MWKFKVCHTCRCVPEVEERVVSKKLMSSVQNVGNIIIVGIWESRGRRKNGVRRVLKYKKMILFYLGKGK